MNSPQPIKFQQVLKTLKDEIDRLAKDGTKIGPLDAAYQNLEQYTSDVTGLEDHLDAIQRRITDPVNASLGKSNRLSVAFGIVGTFLGVGGVLFSIFYNQNGEVISRIETTQTNLNTALQNIGNSINEHVEAVRGIQEAAESQQRMTADLLSLARARPFAPSTVTPVEGEQVLRPYQTQDLLTGNGHTVGLRLTQVRSEAPAGTPERQLVAVFELHVDGNKIGQSEINQRISAATPWNRLDGQNDTFSVFENDVIVVDEVHRFAVVRLTSEEPFHRASGNGPNSTAAYLLKR